MTDALPPPVAKLEAMHRTAVGRLGHAEVELERQRLAAEEALGERDYSLAAVACHRAHQQHRVVEVLRSLLGVTA